MSDKIDNEIRKYIESQNNQMIDHFDGLSPYQMDDIIYYPFEDEKIIVIQELNPDQLKQIPILNQINSLIDIIKREKEIKLTQLGFLPIKFVKELFEHRHIKDDFLDEYNLGKQKREMDIPTVHIARIFLEITGIVKKRNNKISLTKKSEKLRANPHELLKTLFTSFVTSYNWGYFDRYEDHMIGKLGSVFTLLMISRYGNVKREDTFYSEKYFKAFPDLEDILPYNWYNQKPHYHCFSIRTFDRFLYYFGLIKIEEQYQPKPYKSIIKTKLFDQMIVFNV